MAQSKASGSHYALTAIGLGMLVLGVIMAMWNLVPGFSADKLTPQGNKTEIGSGILKSKTFSVAYVLVGAGVALLLLSICLSVRDKRERRRQSEELARIQQQAGTVPRAQEEDSQEEEDDEEEASARYYVPSYDEVMNSSHAGARQLEQSPGMGVSLPSYESLTGLDEPTPTAARADAEARPGLPPDRQNSKTAKRLKPLKVRRIKSEKLHLKDFRINLPDKNAPPPSIEPLTPPPQYDEVQERTPEARPPD